MSTRPKRLTLAQQRACAALDALRDHTGALQCTHGTPGGAPACARCRRAVLRLHEGWHEPTAGGRTDGVPMPDWFRQGMAHPERWTPPRLPTLTGEHDA